MKRWIHAAAYTDLSMKGSAKRSARARRNLSRFTKEDVDFVKQCYDEVTKAISDSYFDDDDFDSEGYFREDSPLGVNISSIKTDYLLEAIEEDLMTEEEFEEIYSLLEEVGAEEAAAYA